MKLGQKLIIEFAVLTIAAVTIGIAFLAILYNTGPPMNDEISCKILADISGDLLLAFIIIALLFLMHIGIFVSRNITAPIEKLKEAAAKISKGNPNVIVDIYTKDEIGILAESFNKMAKNLTDDINQRKNIEEKLQRLVVTDSQTMLYNHRYLMDIIEIEFMRAKRLHQPLAAIMLDIDYFKSINDIYGHQTGDLVLQQVAMRIKQAVRAYDIVTRYGGEEFVVLSPATNRREAVGLARRILYTIGLYNFGAKGHNIKIKMSAGVTSYPDDIIARAMDLIVIADRMLEKAKEAGGNNVYSRELMREVYETDAEKDLDIKTKFLQQKLDKLSRRANQSLMEAIFAFAKTLEAKDHYTGEHVEKTVLYATETAKELNLPEDEIELVKKASMLHDLGKVGISEKILQKPSKLNQEEFEEVKKHPQIAADILRPIQFLQDVIPYILHHHENWDGNGYPYGLKGEEISVGGRIIAIADMYQALISDRPYRKAYSRSEAIDIIREHSGTKLDPKIVEAFLKVLGRLEAHDV